MSDIRLPFGLGENNTLIHIADVESGKKCGCICPSCRVALIAVKGEKRQHHFRHDTDRECKYGLESAIHLAAKQAIMEKKHITLPEHAFSISARDSKGIKHTEQAIVVQGGTVIKFDTVEEEKELHEMKLDILATKSSTPLAIEIFYRHQVDEQKLLKIRSADISALEIDLSDLGAEDVKNWDAFWQSINDPQRIRWLHNSKTSEAHKRAEALLKIKIQEQEQKYAQAEIRQQKLASKDKERLLQALNDLQDIRDNEQHIERIRQEAEKHPAWKHTRQYLRFSWHELPDFINMDVPDGDWIFGCDRRVWQASFYSYFVCKKKGSFSVKMIDSWLQEKVGCKIPACASTVGILGRKYPQLVPDDISVNLPSSWKTLRAYFYRLCELGILEFTGDDWEHQGSAWFKVAAEMPQPKPEPELREKKMSYEAQHISPELLEKLQILRKNLLPSQNPPPAPTPRLVVIAGQPFLVSPPSTGFGRRRRGRL